MTKNVQKNFRFTQDTITKLESIVYSKRQELIDKYEVQEHEVTFITQTYVIEQLINECYFDTHLLGDLSGRFTK